MPEVEIESNEGPAFGNEPLGGMCEIPLQQNNSIIDPKNITIRNTGNIGIRSDLVITEQVEKDKL